MEREPLRQRWNAVWQALDGRDAPHGVFEALTAACSAPDRHYHNMTHVADCLTRLDAYKDLARSPAEVEIALWFHDAVYDTHASDNEERSAEWAAETVGGEAGARIRNLILATRHNLVPEDRDARLIADIDLTILGETPATFDAYEDAIRREYAWVPEETFRTKRAEILAHFLQRDRIYRTPALFARYEAPARHNLAASLKRLARI